MSETALVLLVTCLAFVLVAAIVLVGVIIRWERLNAARKWTRDAPKREEENIKTRR